MDRARGALAVSVFLASLTLAGRPARAGNDALCGATLSESLTLTGDVDCTGYTGTAITIGADGVVLDGNGFRVLAPDATYAVYSRYYDDVTVQNLEVVGWCRGTGVYLGDGSRFTVEHVVADGRSIGVQINNASDVVIRDLQTTGAATGLYLGTVTLPLQLEGLVLREGGYGLWIHHLTGPMTLGPTAVTAFGGNDTDVYLANDVADLTLSGLRLDGRGYGVSANHPTNTGLTFLDLDVSGLSGSGRGIYVGGSGHRFERVVANHRQYGISTNAVSDLTLIDVQANYTTSSAISLATTSPPLTLRKLDVAHGAHGLYINGYDAPVGAPLTIDAYDAGTDSGVLVDTTGTDNSISLTGVSNIVVGNAAGAPPLRLQGDMYGVYAYSTTNANLAFQNIDASGVSGTGTGLYLRGAGLSVDGVTVSDRATGVNVTSASDVSIRGLVADNCATEGLVLNDVAPPLALEELRLTRNKFGLVFTSFDGEHIVPESDPPELAPLVVDPWIEGVGGVIADLSGNETSIDLNTARAIRFEGLTLDGPKTGLDGNVDTNADIELVGVDASGPNAGTGVILRGPGHRLVGVVANHRADGVYTLRGDGVVVSGLVASGCTNGLRVTYLDPSHAAPTLSDLVLRDNTTALQIDHVTRPWTIDGLSTALDIDGSASAIAISYSSDVTLKNLTLPGTSAGGVLAPTGNARLTFEALDVSGGGMGTGLYIGGADAVLTGITANHRNTGVRASNVDDLQITSLTATHNASYGLRLDSTANTAGYVAPSLAGLTLTDNAVGLFLYQWQLPLTVDGAVPSLALDVSGSEIGISLQYVKNVTLKNLTLDNPGSGVDAPYPAENLVFDHVNVSGHGRGYGILLGSNTASTGSAGSGHQLLGVTANDRYMGVSASGAINLVVHDFTATGCSHSGLYMIGVDPGEAPSLKKLSLGHNKRGLYFNTVAGTSAAPIVIDPYDAVGDTGVIADLAGCDWGIELLGTSWVELRDLTIDALEYGVYALSTLNHDLTFDGLDLGGSARTGVGIRLDGSNHRLVDLVVDHRSAGITAAGANLTVSGLHASDCTTALDLGAVTAPLTLLDLSLERSNIGLRIGAPPSALELGPAAITSLRDSTIGIYLSGSTGAWIHDLDLAGQNRGTGIHLATSTGAVIEHVDVSGPGQGTGIRLSASTGATLTDVTADGRTRGIDFDNATNPTLTSVRARRCTYGIYLYPLTLPLTVAGLDVSDDDQGLRVQAATGSPALTLGPSHLAAYARTRTPIWEDSAYIDVDIAALALSAPVGGSYAQDPPASSTAGPDPDCGATLDGVTPPLGTALTLDAGTGTYTLIAPLDCHLRTASPALTIAADGVTLDGAGLAIDAPLATAAVQVTGASGVEVRNVDVSGMSRLGEGVIVTGGAAVTLTDITADDRLRGVSASGTAGLEVTRLTARRASTAGLQLASVSDLVLDGLVLTDGDGAGLSLQGFDGDPLDTGASYVLDGAALADLRGNDQSITLAADVTGLTLTGASAAAPLVLDGLVHGVRADSATNARLTFQWLDLSGGGAGDGLALAGVDHTVAHVVVADRATGVNVGGAATAVTGLHLEDVVATHATAAAVSLSNVALPLTLLALDLTASNRGLAFATFDGAAPITGDPFVIDASAITDLAGNLTSVHMTGTSRVALVGSPPIDRLALSGRDYGLSAASATNDHVTLSGVDASGVFPLGTGVILAGDGHTLDDVVVRARATGVSLSNGAGDTVSDLVVDGVTGDGLALGTLSLPLTVTGLDVTHAATCLALASIDPPVTAAPDGGRLVFDAAAIARFDDCASSVVVNDCSNLGFAGFATRGANGINANDVTNENLRFEGLDVSGAWHQGAGIRVRGPGHRIVGVDASDRATGVYLHLTTDAQLTGITVDGATGGSTTVGTGVSVSSSTGLSLSGLALTRCSVALNLNGVAGTAAAPLDLGPAALTALSENMSDLVFANVQHADVHGLRLSGWNYGLNGPATSNAAVTLSDVDASGPGTGYGVYLGGAGHTLTTVTANDRGTGVFLLEADGFEITGLSARRASSVGLHLNTYPSSYGAPTLSGLTLTDNLTALKLTGWTRPTLLDGGGASPTLGITTARNATDLQITSSADLTLANLAFDGWTAGVHANHAGNARLVLTGLDLSGQRSGDGLVLGGVDHEIRDVTVRGRRYAVDTYGTAGLSVASATTEGAGWCLLLRNVTGAAPASIAGFSCTASAGALYISNYQPSPPFALTAAAGLTLDDVDTGAYLVGPVGPIRFEGLTLDGRDYGVRTTGAVDLTLDGVNASGDGFGTGISAGGTAVHLVDVVANDRATGATLSADVVTVAGLDASHAGTVALSVGPTTAPSLADLSLTDSTIGLTLTGIDGPLTIDGTVLTSLAGDTYGMTIVASRQVTVEGLAFPQPTYGVNAVDIGNRDLVFRDLDVSGGCTGTGLAFAGDEILAQRVVAGRRTTAFLVSHGDGFVIEDSVAGASSYGISALASSLRLNTTVTTYASNSPTYFKVADYTTNTSLEIGETIRVSLDTGDEDVVVTARSSYYITVSPALSKTPEVGTVVRALDAGEPRLVLRSSDICANATGFYSNTLPMTATTNYWRSSTGPTHPSVPAGTGDLVNATNTTLEPFVTVPTDKLNPYCNQAPLPDAGAAQTVCEGDTVQLDASASTDPDVEPLSYAWTQIGGTSATLTSGDTATPTFVAPTPATVPETLSFEVAVADDQLARLAAVDVTVELGNPLPTAVAGDDQAVDEGASVALSAVGSFDPDGTALRYAWVQTGGLAVTLTGADTAAPSFTAPAVGPGGGPLTATLTFELTVTDTAPPGYCGGDKSAVDAVSVDVRNVNVGPTADAGGDQAVDEGVVVALDASGSSDPDGDTLGFVWVQTAGTTVTLSGATTATPTFIAPEQPDLGSEVLSFAVTVSDGFGGIATDNVDVTVEDVCPDSDNDGVIDCLESCDLDPLKLEPGICGCGVPDTDSDGDGAPDCVDGCPADPAKTDPGQCGCGALDTDSDGNGVADCNEDCGGQPDGTVIASGVPCGTGTCGDITGDVTCQDGVAVSSCDPAYAVIPDTTCHVADVAAVAYAIVYDDVGAPRGTIRCTRDLADVITCDEEPDQPGRLRVYDGLYCPGVTP